MSNSSATIDEIVKNTPDWRGEMLAKLRKIIHDADPEVTEETKWRRPTNPNGTPTFEHNGIVCMVGILKERVRLTMNQGANLPDPHKLYNAMLIGNKARAVDFSKGDRIDETALKEIIRSGVEQNLARTKAARARKK